MSCSKSLRQRWVEDMWHLWEKGCHCCIETTALRVEVVKRLVLLADSVVEESLEAGNLH